MKFLLRKLFQKLYIIYRFYSATIQQQIREEEAILTGNLQAKVPSLRKLCHLHKNSRYLTQYQHLLHFILAVLLIDMFRADNFW